MGPYVLLACKASKDYRPAYTVQYGHVSMVLSCILCFSTAPHICDVQETSPKDVSTSADRQICPLPNALFDPSQHRGSRPLLPMSDAIPRTPKPSTRNPQTLHPQPLNPEAPQPKLRSPPIKPSTHPSPKACLNPLNSRKTPELQASNFRFEKSSQRTVSPTLSAWRRETCGSKGLEV